MGSAQTLSDDDRRALAGWAADCAERVLPLFDAEDANARDLIRDALGRTRAYSRGESTAAEEIRKRLVGVKAAAAAATPAGAAAARAIGQAAAVAHMGAHALGAAAYAVKAISLSDPDAVNGEIRWQSDHLTRCQRDALQLLPPLGADASGPLGNGLLSRGVLGEAIRELQQRIGHADSGTDHRVEQ